MGRLVVVALGMLLCCCEGSAMDEDAGQGCEDSASSELVREWLRKAEAAARGIDDEKRRAGALGSLYVTYAEAGDIQGAKAHIAELPGFPESAKAYCLGSIAIVQANGGDIESAVATVGSHHRYLKKVAAICAKSDVPRAIEIAGVVPEPHRSKAFCEIVKEQVLGDDLEGARETAERIVEEECIKEANYWLVAGGVVGGDPNDAAGQVEVGKDDFCHTVVQYIAKDKAEAGKIQEAQKILDKMHSPRLRAHVYTAIAKQQLVNGDRSGFDHAIQQALGELAKSEDDVMAVFSATQYSEIANLQARAGDLQGGVSTIKMACENWRESRLWEIFDKGGVEVFGSKDGKWLLYDFLLNAGQSDEVVRMASDDDGTLEPGVKTMLAMQYGGEGKAEKVEELLESVKSQQEKFGIYSYAINGFLYRTGKKTAEVLP